ncbi:CD209 antigen-like protein C [Carassius auratus]|uniref:CD209 antigen-like protein C n=1 Tax=Carassius auratus TaxID=7957 RepID=A0A6P6KSW7_CARAU|nr:CD209 antigen-like protein C [Carassius auratus]
MYKEDRKSIDNIYENVGVTKGTFVKETTDSKTMGIQSSELTGSDSVKIRNYIAAVVCLVLLCVLLLTAVIVLCLTLIQERPQLISKNENLTNEREQLTLKNTNLTNEREQLILKNTNLTNEREQLILKTHNLTRDRDQLIQEKNDLQRSLGKLDGWIYYQSSLYFISPDGKSWTDSRRYCTERGADLIIINNRDEQDFVKIISGTKAVWIGLTDSEVEGRWKWVDDSTLTSGFWSPAEPNSNYGNEDCAYSYISWWYDYPCYVGLQWICEMNILHIVLP